MLPQVLANGGGGILRHGGVLLLEQVDKWLVAIDFVPRFPRQFLDVSVGSELFDDVARGDMARTQVVAILAALGEEVGDETVLRDRARGRDVNKLTERHQYCASGCNGKRFAALAAGGTLNGRMRAWMQSSADRN